MFFRKLYLPILLLGLFLDSQAQVPSTSPIKNKNNQIGFLIGYSPVYVGSNVGHDKRLAVSFRLTKEKVVYDFDVEYYTSDNPRSRLLRNNDLWFSTNRQETVGYGINIGMSKAVVENTYVGVGLSGNYLDISESLNESIHLLETGEEITDHELSPERRDTNFFSPGIFVQADLSFPFSGNAQFYFKQKFNLMYIGDRFESSFWDTWICYTVFGGLKFQF